MDPVLQRYDTGAGAGMPEGAVDRITHCVITYALCHTGEGRYPVFLAITAFDYFFGFANIKNMKIQNFSVIIEQDRDGFVAECLDLQGCYTQGDTYEEVVKNIKDAIKLYLADRIAKKEKLNASEKSFSLSNLQIAIS